MDDNTIELVRRSRAMLDTLHSMHSAGQLSKRALLRLNDPACLLGRAVALVDPANSAGYMPDDEPGEGGGDA